MGHVLLSSQSQYDDNALENGGRKQAYWFIRASLNIGRDECQRNARLVYLLSEQTMQTPTPLGRRWNGNSGVLYIGLGLGQGLCRSTMK